jgi:hypothetical protein
MTVLLSVVRLSWELLGARDKSSLFHAAQTETRLVPDVCGLRQSAAPLLEPDNTMHAETARAVISLALEEMGI